MPVQKGLRPLRPTGKAMGNVPKAVNLPRLPVRPGIGPSLPGVNLHRAEQRIIRREAARQIAKQVQTARPRPVVRPAAPPRKVMAKDARPLPRPAQPSALRPPAAAPGMSMGAATAATAAAAAGLFTVNAANAHADISAEVSFLQAAL